MRVHTCFSAIVAAAALLAPARAASQRLDRGQYVAKFKDMAVSEMRRTGIPASITLAQGILESDCGNSDLAVVANNHFGIKCHSDWTGKTMHKDDDRRDECFRSYDSAAESFRDHSDFLTSKPRYASLFELSPTDYEGWAHGLKKCGYATERTYAQRLIRIIEEEGLHQYDTEEGLQTLADAATGDDTATSGTAATGQTRRRPRARSGAIFEISPMPPHEVLFNNGVRYVNVGPDDTFAGIAAEFHLMEWELYKYNDLRQGDNIGNLQFVYLRPKKNRAHPDCPTHTVREGDTMWGIAHTYGVKLRKLLRRNRMSADDSPAVGSTLRLR